MSHRPVLLEETLVGLAVRPEGVYLDATVGAGGHTEAVARRLTTGRVMGLDRDPQTLAATARALAPWGDRVLLELANFKDLAAVLARAGVLRLDGVVFDLGTSSMQLDQPQRGFSFRHEGPLDMRMGPDAAHTAAELVNAWSQVELARALRDFGEERFAARIARAIVARRPFRTTTELAEAVVGAVPAAARRKATIHPATRTFQALRIAVNGELDAIPPALSDAFSLLAPGGRLAVIAFHSLEDRLVKRFFQERAKGCTCPPKLPQCVCGGRPQVKAFPLVRPSPQETAANPRARSARLRVGEKLP